MSTRPRRWNKPGTGGALAWLTLLLLGCGDSGGANLQPCEQSDCTIAGYECNLDTNLCEPVCTQAQCPNQAECSARFGRCVAVSCGQFTACVDSGSICDLYADACYPSSGRCAESTDCPLYDGRVAKSASLSCNSGFCHLASQPPDVSTPGSRPDPIVVVSPGSGAQLNSAGDLQFQWASGLGYTTIILVLTDLPKDISQVLSVAVWGHVVPATAPSSAIWQEGTAIVNGGWSASTPAIPSGPLYFLVQGVLDGKLVALSAPIPFRVGSAWPALYDSCSDNAQLPGSCASPLQPQICWSNHCRLLCAAHKDCPSGTLCGAPESGVRICG